MSVPPASPVRLRGVGLTFPGGVRALAGVDLDVDAGALTTIVGPSGCGKSTLLRIVAGLLAPTAGEVAAGPRELRTLMFQEPRLLPWRAIRRQLALPLELLGQPVDRAAIDEALERVGLAGFGDALPHQLSGGMRMRVALARALVTRPRLLLLDEPFGALDEITREAMGEQLLELQAAGGFTALLVTHSVYEAVFLSRRVVVMSARPGRIVGGVEVPFAERPPSLRADPAFARLSGEVSAMLRAGMAEGAA